MPIFALAVTALAAIWTIVAVFAGGMRPVPGRPRDMFGCSVAAVWWLAIASWVIWFFR